MPVALDPAETFDYVISTDRGRDAAPVLVFHFATGREARTIAKLFEDADHVSDVGQSLDLRYQAVRTILAGWRNFTDRSGDEIPFDPANLEDVLSDQDVTELQARLLSEMSMSELQKKRRVFSALSSSANSAGAAPPRNAADPANPSRPSSNAPAAPAKDATSAGEPASSD